MLSALDVQVLDQTSDQALAPFFVYNQRRQYNLIQVVAFTW